MEIVHFSPSLLGFYPEESRANYEEIGAWPEDAVKLTAKQRDEFWKQVPPAGKDLGALDGKPAWINKPPLNAEQVVALRLLAYREESDPLKNEADYDALVSNSQPDYSAWMAKVSEIKERYPMPK